MTAICAAENCGNLVRTKGLCASHYASKWNKENRDQYNKNWRKHYAANAEERRLRERKRTAKRYGISLEDYNAMHDKQNGVCAICGRLERAKLKHGGILRSLAIDHDHTTGRVRGLLCSSCNRGLGKFGDNPETLRRAADYLGDMS